MAKDPDAGAVSKESIGYLEEVKKGKPRKFAMICKGTSVISLVVYKKGNVEKRKKEAKEAGKGQFYFGIVDGKGINIRFVLARADGFEDAPVKTSVLKSFLDEEAEFACKPYFEVVDAAPLALDEDDPLVARYLKLKDAARAAGEAAPDRASELAGLCDSIGRQLDQELTAEATAALDQLEALLSRIGAGGAPPPPPPPPNPAIDADAALKQKLLEALNKLVSPIKELVAADPNRKVELLTPVAAIKKQLDAGELQGAKEGLLKLGQLLKSVQASAQPVPQTPQPQPVAPTQDSIDPDLKSGLKSVFEEQLADLQPDFDKALKDVLGDVSKMRAFMAAALEKAEAGDHVTAIRVLDRLRSLVDEALASGKSPEFLGIQAGLVERRIEMLNRFRELPGILHPLLMDLRDEIITDDADEDPEELTAALELSLVELCEVIRSEVDVSISSGIPADLEGMKSRVLSHPVAKHLFENPFVEGSSFQQAFFAVLDEMEASLTA